VAWLSLFFQCVSAVRRWLFRVGLRKSERVTVPVVSIGNISFGGTGKTPTVIALAKALAARGVSVCILSRGYRRKKTQPTERVDPRGDAARFGDEPLLIARATGVPVIVDAKRARAAAFAIAHHRPQLLLLDDGFSHLQLRRDFDLVLLAEDDMRLVARRRELRRSLRAAHAVATLEETIAEPPANLIRLRRQVPPSVAAALAGQRFIAMAAIAHPERFSALLRAHGATVVRELFFHDHHAFPAGALAAALQEGPVAITEKDAVKLEAIPAGVIVVTMAVTLPETLVDTIAKMAHIIDRA
jgi:tetraacyldisaccharide 4'-kinase